MKLLFASIALVLGLVSASSLCSSNKFAVIVKTSHNHAGLKAAVDKFRRVLGGPDNVNETGPLRKGQRSVSSNSLFQKTSLRPPTTMY